MQYPAWKATMLVGADDDPNQTVDVTVHTDRDAARNVFWPATMNTENKLVVFMLEPILVAEVE